MSVFLPKYGEPGHKKCNLNNGEAKLFAHKWKPHYIAGFYHRREKKWCLNSSLSHQPPPPQPKREGVKQTGLVKGMTSVSKELMWHGKRAGRGQTGEMQRHLWKRGVREPETLFQFHQWPWISHLTSCYSCSSSAHRLLMKWIRFLKTGYENHFC